LVVGEDELIFFEIENWGEMLPGDVGGDNSDGGAMLDVGAEYYLLEDHRIMRLVEEQYWVQE